jgi:hypothetical protein
MIKNKVKPEDRGIYLFRSLSNTGLRDELAQRRSLVSTRL